MNTEQIVILIFFIWLCILTGLFWKINSSLKRLYRGVDGGNFISVLEKILKKIKKGEVDINEIEKKISNIQIVNKSSVQKVGLVKFNPFKELGGDNSFSLALLNGLYDGIIITGLHGRDKTRLYLKSIKKGKGELTLSDEETAALKIALKS